MSVERPVGYGLDFTEFDRQEREAQKARGRQKGAGGFKCPKCGKTTMVVDSRPTEDGVRRRRYCDEGCRDRFTTVERLADTSGTEVRRDVTAAARRLILRVLANLPREGGPDGQGAG